MSPQARKRYAVLDEVGNASDVLTLWPATDTGIELQVVQVAPPLAVICILTCSNNSVEPSIRANPY
jgi:hypothetical protein